MQPKIMKKEAVIIAGKTGDGNKTHSLWRSFSENLIKIGLPNKLSDFGYEIRVYSDEGCRCHVGVPVSDKNVDKVFDIAELPAAEYAIFEVSVAKGYESENQNIDKWLSENSKIYKQARLNGKHYAVEYYDERFNGDEPDSIIEIWIPIIHTGSGK